MPLTLAEARRAVRAVMDAYPRPLNEAEAWRAAAERIEDGKEAYCCVAIDSLFYQELISRAMRDTMHARIQLDIADRYVAYEGHEFADLDSTGREAQAARVLACLMFAEEAADDE